MEVNSLIKGTTTMKLSVLLYQASKAAAGLVRSENLGEKLNTLEGKESQ